MVEILLSSYNGSRWIDEQIESIVNQTYTEWRLIVRDDGSKDDTLKKLYEWREKLGKKKIRIIEGENIGVIKSFETLLKKAHSEYCMLCDQDDVWKRTKVEMTMNEMQRIEKVKPKKPAMVFTSIDLVDENLKPLGTTFFEQNKFDFPFAMSFSNICVCNCVAGCTMMLNWRARRMVVPFSENAPMHDWWIAALVARKGILGVVKMPTMFYRQHGNNVCGAKATANGYYGNLAKSPATIIKKYAEVRKFLWDVGFRGGFLMWLFCKIRHVIHRKCI